MNLVLPSKELGVAPLGTPLIVGPDVLTTSMVIVSQYGLYTTIISILLNILLVGLIFRLSFVLMSVLGDAGARTLSKITSLILAVIAVMLIRKGLEQLLTLPLRFGSDLSTFCINHV